MSFTDSIKSYFSSKDDEETLTENTDRSDSGFSSEVRGIASSQVSTVV